MAFLKQTSVYMRTRTQWKESDWKINAMLYLNYWMGKWFQEESCQLKRNTVPTRIMSIKMQQTAVQYLSIDIFLSLNTFLYFWKSFFVSSIFNVIFSVVCYDTIQIVKLFFAADLLLGCQIKYEYMNESWGRF